MTVDATHVGETIYTLRTNSSVVDSLTGRYADLKPIIYVFAERWRLLNVNGFRGDTQDTAFDKLETQ